MKYTKTQIKEAISYWTKQLRTLNEGGFNPDDPAADRNDIEADKYEDQQDGEIDLLIDTLADQKDEIISKALEKYDADIDEDEIEAGFEDMWDKYFEDWVAEGADTPDKLVEKLVDCGPDIEEQVMQEHPEWFDDDGGFLYDKHAKDIYDEVHADDDLD